MKLTIIGCGLRTPLLLHGLATSDLPVDDVALYDIDHTKSDLMVAMGKVIASGHPMRLTSSPSLETAIEGSDFVISSIRTGGLEARARDERVSLEHGYAGQETTGPAGFAMAFRTVPVSLEHARAVQRLAPRAWIVNFTNPAGIITQAIASHVTPRVIGICDTPAELFYRIALLLGRRPDELEYDYIGLNHLGWVTRVRAGGRDLTPAVLAADLNRLYPAAIFPPELIRSLGFIPSEYLFFYYAQETALRNQLRVGATRGEELLKMNSLLSQRLNEAFDAGQPGAAVQIYKRYLNQRNASYLRLEGSGESSLGDYDRPWDPFQGETGYHRIAIDVVSALSGVAPKRIVANVLNQGAIRELASDDVVETPCEVDQSGARPVKRSRLPDVLKGLVVSIKQYERATIKASVENSPSLATLALFLNPIVSDWESARRMAAVFSGFDSLLFRSSADQAPRT